MRTLLITGIPNLENSLITTSPLLASVFKIHVHPGDEITSATQTVVTLEAMKTEIPVKAGERIVGKIVKGVGHGIKEGAVVKPGEVLIVYNS